MARLATIGARGAPHLVPICFALDRDTLYSAVDSKPKASKALSRLSNLRANPSCTVLVDHYTEDWHELWWVRADGAGRVLDPGVSSSSRERDHGIELLRSKYPQYLGRSDVSRHSLDAAVVAIDVARWSGWRASGATIPRWPGSPPPVSGAR